MLQGAISTGAIEMPTKERIKAVFEKYKTIYQLLFCDGCEGLTSHVSRKGDDFQCLVCMDKEKNKA